MSAAGIILAVVITILVIAIIIFLIIYFTVISVEAEIFKWFDDAINELCSEPDIGYGFTLKDQGDPAVFKVNNSRALYEIVFNSTKLNCQNNNPSIFPPGFDAIEKFSGNDPSDGVSRIFAYAWYNTTPDKVVLAFPMLTHPDEFTDALQYQQVPPTQLNNYVDGQLVHKGFYETYLTVRSQIIDWLNSHDYTELYITGWGPGGALAFLCQFDLLNLKAVKPVMYNYGSCRVGNAPWANHYKVINANSKSFRVFNTEDLLTQLPPPIIGDWFYQHPDFGEIPFSITLDTYGHIAGSYSIYAPFCVGVGSGTHLSTVPECVEN